MITQTKLRGLVSSRVLNPNPAYRVSESKAETSMTSEASAIILGNHNIVMAL